MESFFCTKVTIVMRIWTKLMMLLTLFCSFLVSKTRKIFQTGFLYASFLLKKQFKNLQVCLKKSFVVNFSTVDDAIKNFCHYLKCLSNILRWVHAFAKSAICRTLSNLKFRKGGGILPCNSQSVKPYGKSR